MSASHLVADISGHGFGHVAMTAPVLNAVGAARPDVRLTIRSSAPERVLREHVQVPFELVSSTSDFGMFMRGALEVDADASYRKYSELHSRWDAAVGAGAESLEALAPTLLLANVPYLSLAAASRANVPAIALCCLNWADIFEHYCSDGRESQAIAVQMRDAYRSADVFLAPEPAMLMPGLPNLIRIGPIARLGRRRADEIRRALQLDETIALALLSLGGVPFRIDVATWPRLQGWHVLAAMEVAGAHPDVSAADALPMPHIDLLASCDALVTKPGYGTTAEAGVNGVPMLYVSRDGWPEESTLVAWLERVGRCAALPAAALREGSFLFALERVRENQTPAPVPPTPDGIEAAAALLIDRL
ncbi:MAG: hypothetical protein ABI831_22880 [Betaproteobacteria bacterium]